MQNLKSYKIIFTIFSQIQKKIGNPTKYIGSFDCIIFVFFKICLWISKWLNISRKILLKNFCLQIQMCSNVKNMFTNSKKICKFKICSGFTKKNVSSCKFCSQIQNILSLFKFVQKLKKIPPCFKFIQKFKTGLPFTKRDKNDHI